MEQGFPDRLEDLFDRALALPPEERAAFLDGECSGDPALRAQLEGLLSAQPRAFDWFDALSDDVVRSAPLEAEAGAWRGVLVGPWRLLDLIGAGGMGTVYLAERADGQFEQRVALKLVRGGLASPGALDRFRSERQILAGIEHPAVARLLDGGITADGLPYLVMEHVDGVPLTDHCDARRLSLRARLELFIALADGVQYLHRHLVVHRDLKPANVLVDRDGRPRLLDFGIARLLDDEAQGDLTRTGTRVLTPVYAAPEQLLGRPVTTAADVYALGALLHELLVGRRPFERGSGEGLLELERAVVEREPPLPSALARSEAEGVPPAAGRAQARGTTPERLQRRLKGDLDAICLKALRKEPEARYPTAGQMVEDVRRFLDGEPVLARRGSTGYRMGKFVRRHRLAVTAGAALLLLTVGFGLFTWAQAVRLQHERDRAETVAALLVDLFTVADPGTARAASVTAREVLDRGAQRLERGLADQPELKSTLLVTLGRVYRNLGLYDEARGLFEEALALRRAVLGPAHPDVAEALTELGELLRLRGELELAETSLSEAVRVARGRGADDALLARGLDRLGLVVLSRGRMDEADSLFEQAMALNQRPGEPEVLEVAENVQNLGAVRAARGDLAAAEPYFRRALTIRERELGPEHPAAAASANNLAAVLAARGAFDEAVAVQETALARYRDLLGPDHPQVATLLNNLGMMKRGKGDPASAETDLRASLELRRAELPPLHPDLAQSLSNLGLVLQDLGQPDEAERVQREALTIRESAFGPEHPQVAQSLNNLGLVLQETRDYDVAEGLFERALAIFREALGDAHPLVAASLHNLAALRAERDDLASAETLYREALAARRALFSGAHPDLALTLLGLGEVLLARGDATAAEPLLSEALAARRALFAADHWQVAEAESALGAALLELGRAGEAAPLLRSARDRLAAARGEADPLTLEAGARLARLESPP